jgi:hypothetical protein
MSTRARLCNYDDYVFDLSVQVLLNREIHVKMVFAHKQQTRKFKLWLESLIKNHQTKVTKSDYCIIARVNTIQNTIRATPSVHYR